MNVVGGLSDVKTNERGHVITGLMGDGCLMKHDS